MPDKKLKLRKPVRKVNKKGRSWNGMCKNNVHGLDFFGQHCAACDVTEESTNEAVEFARQVIVSPLYGDDSKLLARTVIKQHEIVKTFLKTQGTLVQGVALSVLRKEFVG